MYNRINHKTLSRSSRIENNTHSTSKCYKVTISRTLLNKTRALGIQCKLCFVEQRRKENRASLIKKFNLQELILKCVVILLGMLLMANLTWHKNEFKFLDVKKETMKYEQ